MCIEYEDVLYVYRWVQNTTMLVDLGEDSFFQGTIADITEHIEKETRQ